MSSVIDYFSGVVSDTYAETVSYWSNENSALDAIDAIAWSVKNGDIVAEATKKGFNEEVKKIDTAITQDRNKLIIIALALGIGYYYFKGGKVGK